MLPSFSPNRFPPFAFTGRSLPKRLALQDGHVRAETVDLSLDGPGAPPRCARGLSCRRCENRGGLWGSLFFSFFFNFCCFFLWGFVHYLASVKKQQLQNWVVIQRTGFGFQCTSSWFAVCFPLFFVCLVWGLGCVFLGDFLCCCLVGEGLDECVWFVALGSITHTAFLDVLRLHRSTSSEIGPKHSLGCGLPRYFFVDDNATSFLPYSMFRCIWFILQAFLGLHRAF